MPREGDGYDIAHAMRIVAEKAVMYFPAIFQSAAVVYKLPFHVRSTYPIYLLALENGTEKPAAKIVVKFAPVCSENNEGLTEFNNMRRLHSAFRRRGSEGIGIPRPLDFIHEINALVTEYVEVQRFSDWFVRSNSWFATQNRQAELQKWVWLAGKWLGAFHDETKTGTVSFADCGVVADIERRLQRAEEMGLRRSVVNEVLNWVSACTKRFANTRLPTALTHGDFGLQNIGISSDTLHVFDLQRSHQAVTYHDVCYFLVTLETMNSLPWNPCFSRSRARTLQREFLDGYCDTGAGTSREICADVLSVFYVQNLIQRLVKQGTNIRSRGNSVADWFFRLHLVGRAFPARLLRELKTLRTPNKTAYSQGVRHRACSG